MYEYILSTKEGATAAPRCGRTVFVNEYSQVEKSGYEIGVARPSFGKLLQEAIQGTKLSLRAWATQQSGLTPGQISNIITGRRTPPLDQVPAWADKLGLVGRKRQRFLDLAALAHLPPEVEARFVRFLDEHDRQGEQIAELQKIIESLPKKRKS